MEVDVARCTIEIDQIVGLRTTRAPNSAMSSRAARHRSRYSISTSKNSSSRRSKSIVRKGLSADRPRAREAPHHGRARDNPLPLCQEAHSRRRRQSGRYRVRALSASAPGSALGATGRRPLSDANRPRPTDQRFSRRKRSSSSSILARSNGINVVLARFRGLGRGNDQRGTFITSGREVNRDRTMRNAIKTRVAIGRIAPATCIERRLRPGERFANDALLLDHVRARVAFGGTRAI